MVISNTILIITNKNNKKLSAYNYFYLQFNLTDIALVLKCIEISNDKKKICVFKIRL